MNVDVGAPKYLDNFIQKKMLKVVYDLIVTSYLLFLLRFQRELGSKVF